MIRQEYQEKLSEIEREREEIVQDKQEADKYKHILHGYSNILGAITSRLNERDEQIIQLQEELEAYDRIHRETEQIIELKSKRCQQLESYIQDSCSKQVPQNPFETDDLQQMSGLPGISHISEKTYEQFDDSLYGGVGQLTPNQKIQELE